MQIIFVCSTNVLHAPPQSTVQSCYMPSMPTASEPLPIHVAIVEDDPNFSDALSRVVQAAPDMRLTGLVRHPGTRIDDVARSAGRCAAGRPGLAGRFGHRRHPGRGTVWPSCSIMVSTNFGDETHVMRSIEAGAAGDLLKDSSPVRMIDEIRSLASGGSPISPIIARQILARFRQNSSGNANAQEKTADSAALLWAREGSTEFHHQGLHDTGNREADAVVPLHCALLCETHL